LTAIVSLPPRVLGGALDPVEVHPTFGLAPRAPAGTVGQLICSSPGAVEHELRNRSHRDEVAASPGFHTKRRPSPRMRCRGRGPVTTSSPAGVDNVVARRS
jgi:hypothetical protein